MQHANFQHSFSRSTLTRLLAGLAADRAEHVDRADRADRSEPAQARQPTQPATPIGLAAGLGAWLDWTQAISLAAVLGATARPPGKPGAPPGAGDAAGAASRAAQAVRRVREERRCAIAEDPVLLQPPAADFEPLRRRCTAHQQAMATASAGLRGPLRTALAAASAGGARLAAIDAQMANALAAREAQLFTGVTARLAAHFENLRDAQGPQASAPEVGTDNPTTRTAKSPNARALAAFGRIVQAVLLAELDTRLQPAEGLLQALIEAAHPCPPDDLPKHGT